MNDPFGPSPIDAATGAPSPKIAAIREFLAAGFTLIPLRGKIPSIPDWVNTPRGRFGEAQLAEGNYGVALKADDLVVDIDPRNFQKGDSPVARLIEKIGPLQSFRVRTGGGGYHVYLKKPADLQVVGQLKEFPGIEFKSYGRQVVGPGSTHPISGKQYETVSGTINQIAEAPAELLALIKKIAVPFVEVNAGTGTYKNDAATQGRYLAYLQDNAPTSGSFVVACHGRDLGLPPAITWELMVEVWNKRRVAPRSPEELKEKVIHAYNYARGKVGSSHPEADFKDRPMPVVDAPHVKEKPADISWVTDAHGAPKKCFQNLLTYFRYPAAGLVGVFGYNEFTGRVVFTNPAPWHHGKLPAFAGVGDNDLKLLKGHLAVRHGYEAEVTNIEEAVTITAHANKFHPVREYLGGLVWDGKRRLDSWLTEHLGVEDSDYTRACARKVLCAAVMRVMRPGCKFDHVLVLEGPQDIGKSSVCRILGGEWAADFPIDPHNKDCVQLMQGKWVIELAELEVTRKADMSALKAFITRTKDEARLAYGRTVGEFPRQSIFIGSINPGADGTYLADDENRRWWPVVCRPKGGQVDFAALKAARNQLWAEAVALVKAKGEHLYMETKELKDAARGVVALRHADHAWTERIGAWLHELDAKPETRRDFLTARDVFTDAMGGIDQNFDRRKQLGIAQVLRKLGWKAGSKRFGERVSWGYVRESEKKSAQDDATRLGIPLAILSGLL